MYLVAGTFQKLPPDYCEYNKDYNATEETIPNELGIAPPSAQA